MNEKLTWEEIRAKEVGTILHDEFDEGIRFIIMRGPGSLCAYIGIPLDHPLANKSYNDLSVSAHGGLTFAKKGEKGFFPEGFFWYGWDYAHSGDYCFYNDEPCLSKFKFNHLKEKKWLIEDVIKDSWETKYDFKKLMKLAEEIKNQK